MGITGRGYLMLAFDTLLEESQDRSRHSDLRADELSAAMDLLDDVYEKIRARYEEIIEAGL